MKANKTILGWFTLFLSVIYFSIAFYQLILFFTSAEARKYGVNVLIFPQAFLLIGIGILRIMAGYQLLGSTLNKSRFILFFGLFCFFELVLGFMYSLVLVDRLGIVGNGIVIVFVIYYVFALLFFIEQNREKAVNKYQSTKIGTGT